MRILKRPRKEITLAGTKRSGRLQRVDFDAPPSPVITKADLEGDLRELLALEDRLLTEAKLVRGRRQAVELLLKRIEERCAALVEAHESQRAAEAEKAPHGATPEAPCNDEPNGRAAHAEAPPEG